MSSYSVSAIRGGLSAPISVTTTQRALIYRSTRTPPTTGRCNHPTQAGLSPYPTSAACITSTCGSLPEPFRRRPSAVPHEPSSFASPSADQHMAEEQQFSVWHLSSGPRPSDWPTTTFRNWPESQASQANAASGGRMDFLVGTPYPLQADCQPFSDGSVKAGQNQS